MSESINEVFKFKPTDYKNDINPIKHYLEVSNHIVSTISGDDKDYTDDIKSFIKTNRMFHNPKLYFYERDLDGNRSKKVTDLLSYINYVKDSGDIMVPSFTVYFSKDKKKSLHAEFINVNVRERSKHKKLAFKYKMQEMWDLFNYHNTIQKTKKIFNNSLSGAYASAGTVLNNPSAHYTLTSITRGVSGIGNALSESMIEGNKHYRSPDVLLAHIGTIVVSSDLKQIEKIVKKYRLHIPTAEEVMKALYHSFSKYWRDIKKEMTIFKYLKNLSGLERVAILYHNDLRHLRDYNPEFMRKLLDDYLNVEIIDDKGLTDEEINDAVGAIDDWVYNLVMLMIVEKVKGKKFDDLTREDKVFMISYAKNISDVTLKYKDLFQTFLITKVFPVSIAHIKDMVREAIVLSDTDSTCATYNSWVEWYFGRPDFSDKAIAISAIIMTLVTQVMDHYIKMFAGNMNILYEDAQVLQMKNEFFWDVFVNTNVSKHYFANVRVQEGNVYDFKDPLKGLEKKGVHLIAPNAYGPIRKLSEQMMIDIMQTVSKGQQLSLEKYLNQVLEAEQMIYTKLMQGSPDVLKLEKIKEAKSYKNGEFESPYMHHLLWKDVFEYKYGLAPEPTYMAIKIPTIINSKADMSKFLSETDQEFSNRLKTFMEKAGKDTIKTFKPPLIVVHEKGIPTELLPIIDVKRVIKDNCKVLYIILESIGYYIKEDETLSEMLQYNLEL